MSSERVQKILAQAGIASRRKAEELISQGEVTINGKVAQLGDKAEMGKDAIKVKGKLIHKVDAPIYIAFYKPKQIVSTMSDPAGRPCLADYLTKLDARVYPIGRLDFNSEGILLLTNDGQMAEAIQKHPEIPRVYRVKVKGHPTVEMVARIEKGAKIHTGRVLKPTSVRVAQDLENKAVLELVFVGGGATDVKSLLETLGLLVEKMVRTSFGHINTSSMRPGEIKMLKKSQIQALIDQPELGLKQLKEEQDSRKSQRAVWSREPGAVVIAREAEREAARQEREGDSERAQMRPARPTGTGKYEYADAKASHTNKWNMANRYDPRVSRDKRETRGGRDARGPRPAPTFNREPSAGEGAGPRKAIRPLAPGEARPAFQRDSFREERRPSSPGYGIAREPRAGEGRESRGGGGGNRAAFGSKPSYGDQKPSFGGDRKPSFGGKPSLGDDRKPSFGDRKPSFGGDRKPSFGGDRKLSFGGKPSFGGDRKPRFGGSDEVRRPRPAPTGFGGASRGPRPAASRADGPGASRSPAPRRRIVRDKAE